MRSFWPHLLSQWLELLANQLETLTLYWDNHWGLFPPMDLRKLHFTRLKSLSLGTYVFSLDEQLEWLLSHKTLEHLSFDSCAICSNWNIPDPPTSITSTTNSGLPSVGSPSLRPSTLKLGWASWAWSGSSNTIEDGRPTSRG
ncbi:hypothetical protein QBC33DRAFT_574750 [Phialemonium atrogriseum]|uniref:Uncharacterized protein n=1 Tax=Phialemonium atrogriseum TaxID=1093897 RepID=A0AAJ0BRG6_9PEZI|nr:uncharacterized protein QBC33DRAFT_574750 [Phialemonium atrogriseum]KAK1761662.1 hypothetical protein QBC33DRAFT_574750 [Phialemonium atrogriseum]